MLEPDEATRIFAMSVDDAATSKAFASKIASDRRGAIEFSILSDPKHTTIDAYGLRDAAYDGEDFEGIPHPAVYVIGKDRRVAWAVVEDDYRKRPTNADIRAALEALKQR